MTKEWTNHEAAVVRALYPILGVRGVVCALPRRSPRAIQQFAYRNGIEGKRGRPKAEGSGVA